MLSTTVSNRIELEISINAARAVCKRLVTELGWKVIRQHDDLVKLKAEVQDGQEFVWPAEVEIKIIADRSGVTCFLLKGSSLGNGPRQKGHIEAQLSEIRNKIEGIAEKT